MDLVKVCMPEPNSLQSLLFASRCTRQMNCLKSLDQIDLDCGKYWFACSGVQKSGITLTLVRVVTMTTVIRFGHLQVVHDEKQGIKRP